MDIISAKSFSKNFYTSTIDDDRNRKIDESVLHIIAEVRKKGDNAVKHFSKQFDNVSLHSFTVTEEEFAYANERVSEQFIEAMTIAKQNITTFHEGQIEKSWFMHKND